MLFVCRPEAAVAPRLTLPSPPLVHRSTVTLQGSQMKSSHCDLWDVISGGGGGGKPDEPLPLVRVLWVLNSDLSISPESQRNKLEYALKFQ